MIDGNVKYTAQHSVAPAIEAPGWAELNAMRTRLFQLGVIGVTKDGIGFGNVSIRYQGNEFLISGTKTGSIPELSANEYCLVSSINMEQNSVVTMGPIAASSEAMAHGAVYESCPAVLCVMHIHSRPIFDGMLKDKHPATPESAEYGTPEIALAVAECVKAKAVSESAIVLAGHDEGIIAYGSTAEQAFSVIKNLYDTYNA